MRPWKRNGGGGWRAPNLCFRRPAELACAIRYYFRLEAAIPIHITGHGARPRGPMRAKLTSKEISHGQHVRNIIRQI